MFNPKGYSKLTNEEEFSEDEKKAMRLQALNQGMLEVEEKKRREEEREAERKKKEREEEQEWKKVFDKK